MCGKRVVVGARGYGPSGPRALSSKRDILGFEHKFEIGKTLSFVNQLHFEA